MPSLGACVTEAPLSEETPGGARAEPALSVPRRRAAIPRGAPAVSVRVPETQRAAEGRSNVSVGCRLVAPRAVSASQTTAEVGLHVRSLGCFQYHTAA